MRADGIPAHREKEYDTLITTCVKTFITDRGTVSTLIFKRPMYLGLIIFSDI